MGVGVGHGRVGPVLLEAHAWHRLERYRRPAKSRAYKSVCIALNATHFRTETMNMLKKGQLQCLGGQSISAANQFYNLAL